MLQRATQGRLLAISGGLALIVLYLYGLDRMGLYGPDEPRYASIGREMARTGDLITPRLWGDAWFEKPPLLYWIVSGAFRVGLSIDLAPRVPVALLSVAFLFAFFWMVRREFSIAAAAYSTTILATSAGWIALSQVAVTDLPMSAMFGLALLFTLPWLRRGDRRWLNAAAVALGVAFLAKSAPPLVLAIPALWFGRERWRDLFRPTPVLLFLAVAAPWHIVCNLRNGPVFLRTLFWQHQVERFVSPSLQHVQRWWFYIPMLPAGFFPWTPALALLFRRDLYSDRRLQFLLATAVWGLVFFSASTNKLPTYLLPLLPPIAIVTGVALERAQLAGRVVVGLSALLCCAFPVLVMKLPGLMSRNPEAAAPGMPTVLAVIVLLLLAAACFIRNRTILVAMVAALACTGYLWIKVASFPFIDQSATARPVWRQLQSIRGPVCAKDLPRDWRYGLNYYTEKPLPGCGGDASTATVVAFQNQRLSVAPPVASSPSDLIGSIDFYGYGNLDLAKLRETLPFRLGDPVSRSEGKDALQALRKAAGRDAVIGGAPCCNPSGRTLIYVGLAEPGAPPIQFNPRPQGDLKLPPEALKILDDLDVHFVAAIERGLNGEDDTQGYTLSEDPASRADQMKLLTWTRAYTDLVLQVLAQSRSAEQRAFAAQALGYAKRSPQQIAALVSAAFDSDGEVRNAAVRALGVLCTIGTEVIRQIPAQRFIPLLHSITWTDRNKGSFMLDVLTRSRDPALLKLLHDRALGPLREMAQWSNFGHSHASVMILGRVAGIDDRGLAQMDAAQVRELVRSVQ